MLIGSYQLKNNLVVAPMAGVPTAPSASSASRWALAWRSPRWWRAIRSSGLRENAAARRSRRRSRAHRGPDRGRRSQDARRGRPYNVDEGRDHRHQYGLSGQEGVQRHGRLGAPQGRAAGRSILDAVVGAVNVPVTLKIRTGWDRGDRNALASPVSRKTRGCARSPSRAHARLRLLRRCRVPDHCGGQGAGHHSGHRQWRYPHAGKGEAGP